jgi:hypothetical protein
MNRHTILFILTLGALAMVLAVSPPPPPSRAQSKVGQVVSSGQIQSHQGTKQAHSVVHGPVSKTPPEKQPEMEDEGSHSESRLDPPVDPSVRQEDIRPTNAETVVSRTPLATRNSQPNAPLAPGTFTFYRNTSLASAPVVGGTTLSTYNPVEPSAAANGRVVFYTTNNYAGVSGDGGQTFTYLNPFTFFAAANGGFGGDQYVYYERTRGLTLWLLQYNPDTVNNTHRIAVARSQADVINNTWFYFDFTPADFGFTAPPAGANGFWMDFPDMAVSDNFLWLTTNVFPRVLPNPGNPCAGTCPTQTCPAGCSSCTSNCTAVGAVIYRIPLNDLKAGGPINFLYASDTNFGYRLTQGAHTTMYWGSHNTTSQIRIYRWDENGNSIALDNVNHAAYTVAPTCVPPNQPACGAGSCGNMLAVSPDGTNFACTADSRILGAWVAGGVIGFMWNAAQGGSFAYPHVEVVRFNESNRNLIGQGQVFSASFAFLYPSVHPNDRGHLGGTMAVGGGSSYPFEIAWIADDFNNGTITPLENATVAVGTAGPTCNRWGDYYATRLEVPYGNTWVGTGYVVNTTTCNGIPTGGNNWDPHFVWFGRERDTPPATNTIYVDKLNASGYEDGTLVHPYSTFAKGNFACSAGDTLMVRAGNYNETGTFNRAAIVKNLSGTVKLGTP